jgi:hypothetical protein
MKKLINVARKMVMVHNDPKTYDHLAVFVEKGKDIHIYPGLLREKYNGKIHYPKHFYILCFDNGTCYVKQDINERIIDVLCWTKMLLPLLEFLGGLNFMERDNKQHIVDLLIKNGFERKYYTKEGSELFADLPG